MFKYVSELARVKDLAKAINYPLDKGAKQTNTILLSNKLGEKFFLFINYYELHEPYRGENRKERCDEYVGIHEIRNKTLLNLKEQYRLGVEYLDEQIGGLMAMLKLRDLYENALIIVTSDHGQAFNEHGYMYHNVYLYDEIIQVPLIIKYPHGKKYPKKQGYQSLVNIPKLIIDILSGGDDHGLTQRTVFSEADGEINWLPKRYNKIRRKIGDKYEKSRKAVYSDGFKLTVNGTDGTIEEFLKGNKEIDPKKYNVKARELVKELKKFNNNPSFKFPDNFV
jgi:arylsulfatase A-like enzyme